MNTSEPTSPIKSSGMDANRKIQLGLVAALVAVAAGMYGWKWAAVNAVEDKLTQVEAQQVQARTRLIEQAGQLHASRSEEALRQFSVPLGWAIRRELMAGNLDQIDQYFTNLMQIGGFESAVLAQPDGKVVVASDRKRLTQPFSSLYPAQYLQDRAVKIERAADGKLRAIVPILGLNQHLGTMVVEYLSPAFILK
jgi:hypothetical protein